MNDFMGTTWWCVYVPVFEGLGTNSLQSNWLLCSARYPVR